MHTSVKVTVQAADHAPKLIHEHKFRASEYSLDKLEEFQQGCVAEYMLLYPGFHAPVQQAIPVYVKSVEVKDVDK